MAGEDKEWGFTVVEMVVTLAVTGIFVTLFFQMFIAAEVNKAAVVRRSAANDLALTNLRKISTRTQVDTGASACRPGTSGNSAIDRPALLSDPKSGSVVTFTGETITAPLPSTTTQSMRVIYPRGCNSTLPAKITSIVTYGTTASEEVVHVGYVN